MAESKLQRQIARKDSDKERIAKRVIKDPHLLPEILDGLGAETAGVKYGCAKILRIVSEEAPEVLYPKFDLFADLLDSDNKIMRWEGIHVIGNLASVDRRGKIDKIFRKYVAPIPGPVMITAANVVGGAAKIAVAKPKLAERIARELLKVEKAKYRTAECRNVALGHVIHAFDEFFDRIKNKKPVVQLVKRQIRNRRPATRKKAERFVQKYGL